LTASGGAEPPRFAGRGGESAARRSLAIPPPARYKARLTRRHGRATAPQGMPRRRRTTPDKDDEMPKLKTKSGAKKRFSRTASGKVKANVAHKRHRLISKPKQMKRKARGTMTLTKGDSNLVHWYMPYMRG
jgi:large subunit ribosomal protein L35